MGLRTWGNPKVRTSQKPIAFPIKSAIEEIEKIVSVTDIENELPIERPFVLSLNIISGQYRLKPEGGHFDRTDSVLENNFGKRFQANTPEKAVEKLYRYLKRNENGVRVYVKYGEYRFEFIFKLNKKGFLQRHELSFEEYKDDHPGDDF